MRRTAVLLTGAAAALAVASAAHATPAAAASAPVTDPSNPALVTPVVTDSGGTVSITGAGVVVSIARSPWRVALHRADGTPLVQEATAPAAPDPITDVDGRPDSKPDGAHDVAYPGPATLSYQPLGYHANGTWHRVASLSRWSLAGDVVQVAASTDDGAGAAVTLDIAGDSTVHLTFAPAARGVDLVEESFAAPPTEHYFGAGERFDSLDQRGRRVPLWISHGVGSDGYTSSNEIAAPFLWSTGGWGFWANTSARGELNVAIPAERADAVGAVFETNRLDLQVFIGSPQTIVQEYTARSGRPRSTPPSWAWEPMMWTDQNIDDAQIREFVNSNAQYGIPLGAVWIDNPWEPSNGDLGFDPKRFPDPAGLISYVHSKGVRLMTWVSPFMASGATGHAQYAASGWLVGNTPTDNNDATYFPPRGLSPHVDYTNAGAMAAWTALLQHLVAQGVDGVKMDRGEEDLGDASTWSNGLPNTVNHNQYVVEYDKAAYDAFQQALAADPGRGPGDFLILARGGYSGSQQYANNWASDNLSGSGPFGLDEAMRSLESLSMSGFPVSGSDIGGYTGTGTPGCCPSRETFLRWAELGALSPIMESYHEPWTFVDATSELGQPDSTVSTYKKYAVLHHLLAPYTARWVSAAVNDGVPIVRPLPFAYPNDPVAVATDDEYLYGPDLLVAPVHDTTSEGADAGARTVHLPAGGWTDYWTGIHLTGPIDVPVVAPLDTLPLYVRDGASLPPGVAPTANPLPSVPEAPLALLLVAVALPVALGSRRRGRADRGRHAW